MNHVVMLSSGAMSAVAAHRLMAWGIEPTLLFSNVKGNNPSPHAGEDEDNYRFLDDITAFLGIEPIVLNEGRDIWQVYYDEHMLGNSQVAKCSHRLKQEPARAWLEANADPATTVLYIGMDWTEYGRRGPTNQEKWKPWPVVFPMLFPPLVDKRGALDWLKAQGIRPPRLYDLGWSHANCGGFCCRMGQAQAAHLLRVMPERFAYHEQREQEFREHFDFDVAFLKHRSGRDKDKPLTLRALRQRAEQQPSLLDLDDWGACDCFTAIEAAS